MPQPIPYLAFDGNCAEAMRFYEGVFGGTIEIMMSGADSPMAAQMPKEFAHRILHARLAFPDGGVLFAGDGPAGYPYDGVKGVSLALNYPTVAEAEKVFCRSVRRRDGGHGHDGGVLGQDLRHGGRQIRRRLDRERRATADRLNSARHRHLALTPSACTGPPPARNCA